MSNRPAPEIEITPRLVKSLIEEQFPDWARRPLELLDRGWDNTSIRLGDDLLVRIPHRAVAVPLIEHEQRSLPEIAERVELSIPAPVGAGRPSDALGYPWRWSVVPWIEGEEAASVPLRDPAATAERLGTFFRQLHVPAPADAPPNPHRGGPITEKQQRFVHHLGELGDRVDVDVCRRVFDEAAAAPAATTRVWLHGDLHTRNLLVSDGELVAVIDWGDVCSGDRATDLAGAWMLVPDHVEVVAAAAGADHDAWRRSRGWAVYFAIVYLALGADDLAMAAIADRLLDALYRTAD